MPLFVRDVELRVGDLRARLRPEDHDVGEVDVALLVLGDHADALVIGDRRAGHGGRPREERDHPVATREGRAYPGAPQDGVLDDGGATLGRDRRVADDVPDDRTPEDHLPALGDADPGRAARALRRLPRDHHILQRGERAAGRHEDAVGATDHGGALDLERALAAHRDAPAPLPRGVERRALDLHATALEPSTYRPAPAAASGPAVPGGAALVELQAARADARASTRGNARVRVTERVWHFRGLAPSHQTPATVTWSVRRCGVARCSQM